MKHLIEAALDQPNPSPALVAALQKLLTERNHPARLQDGHFNPRPF